ncbi:MAG: substrate-binding domain-containing protein, partial [Actinobacteria bacterium]|nr:substrate-binding domain-containing protein [Actinomycetota bacterium]
RLEAFLSRALALDPDVQSRVYEGDFSFDWGHEAALRILRARPLPDAIVCANDLNAVGALQALREHHVQVPGDVAVTGFDDTLLAVASGPQLTTIRQPVQDLAGEAVSALRAAIADPSLPPRSTELQAGLVVRESSLRTRGDRARPQRGS